MISSGSIVCWHMEVENDFELLVCCSFCLPYGFSISVIYFCEAVYVGETKRTLNIRTNEQISAVKSASQRSHTAEHCWKYNHDFDWNNKRVLDFEKNWKTRIIKEAIYSEENKHHINGVSFKLPATWKPILQKNKEKQARKFDRQKHIAIKPESGYVRNANQPISNDHQTFRSPCKHINTTHFTIYTCL